MNLDKDGSIDQNQLMKHVILSGAYFINHIYLDVFIVVSHKESAIFNAISWGLFIYKVFMN